jgi:PKD repeat protein
MGKSLLRRSLLLTVAMLSACTVHNSEVPGLSGPSEGTGPLQPLSPTASFSFTPTTPAANSPVLFDGSSSCAVPTSGTSCSTGTTQITSYRWNFGDGATASGPVASHAFGVSQTYGVTLTVTNSGGRDASVARTVSVAAGVLPTPAFTLSPTNPHAGTTVTFNASTSIAGTGHTIVAYNWAFGDASLDSTASGQIVSHIFLVSHTYVVTLTVVDEAGQSRSVTTPITIAP